MALRYALGALKKLRKFGRKAAKSKVARKVAPVAAAAAARATAPTQTKEQECIQAQLDNQHIPEEWNEDDAYVYDMDEEWGDSWRR